VTIVGAPRREDVAIHEAAHAVVRYLHFGRHVATTGEASGTLPVNRVDADSALSLVRVMFSYISRAIAFASPN